MTDVTPITRAARRQAAKVEREAQKDRERWFRDFTRQMQQALAQQLHRIHQADPTFEARLLSGFACNISLHLLSPEDMAALQQQVADAEKAAEVQPTGLLDAQGEPIVKADG